jgi:hypothetical protein
MRKAGWFRLWLVLTVVGVPALSWWQFQHDYGQMEELNRGIVKTCVDVEYDSPRHPDSTECLRRMGADKTYFERNNITPGRYWRMSLAVSLAIDLVLTGLIVALALVLRWVVRGFRPATR